MGETPQAIELRTIEDVDGVEYLHRDDVEAWLLNRSRALVDGTAVGEVGSLVCEGLVLELRKSREELLPKDGSDAV